VIEQARRLAGRVSAAFRARRDRHGWLDHLVRAAVRYDTVAGHRLAAGVTYYGFLAVFPLLLLAYALLGWVAGHNEDVTTRLSEFLAANLPTLEVERIAEARYTAGILGLVGVVYAGLGWVDTLRSAVLAIWERDEERGGILLTKLVDFAALLALGPIYGASIALSVLLNSGTEWGLRQLGVNAGGLNVVLTVVAFAVGVLVNLVVFTMLLAALPRLRIPFGRLFPPALLGAIGFELLKAFSRYALGYTMANPAYRLVASAVGVLIFLNLFNQLLLFCASLTATGDIGEVQGRRAFAARIGRIRTRPARRVTPVAAPAPGAIAEPSSLPSAGQTPPSPPPARARSTGRG
jgi:membrane protein